jgi:hypothetical protein
MFDYCPLRTDHGLCLGSRFFSMRSSSSVPAGCPPSIWMPDHVSKTGIAPGSFPMLQGLITRVVARAREAEYLGQARKLELSPTRRPVVLQIEQRQTFLDSCKSASNSWSFRLSLLLSCLVSRIPHERFPAILRHRESARVWIFQKYKTRLRTRTRHARTSGHIGAHRLTEKKK